MGKDSFLSTKVHSHNISEQ